MVIIILLFVFLFSFKAERGNDEIQSGNNLAGANTYNFEALQEELNFCLENSVEKSLLLASGQGGLLYDEGTPFQKYIMGAYFEDYQRGVLDPYDLYLFEVLYHTMISGSGRIEIGPVDIISPNSMNLLLPGYKKQFQEYILNEVFECVDFNSYESNGFFVDRKQVTTTIISKESSNRVKLKPFEGNNGDNLFLERGDTIYRGVLLISNGEYIGDFSSSALDLSSDSSFTNYRVINKDLSVYVDLDFVEEYILATFYFPIVFEETRVFVSSLDVEVTIENRYLSLLRASRELIEQKLRNRSLDYTDSNDLAFGLQNTISQVNVSVTKVIDSPEYKRYIYSLFDLETQFLGKPLQFQFAYENYAPLLDFTLDSICFTSDDTTCSILFTPGDLKELDLSSILIPVEQRDSHNVIFEEINDITTDTTFTLDLEGSISFRSNRPGLYTYPIRITDGETYKEYELQFLSGSLDNVDNQDASSCFIIEYFMDRSDLDLYFPISNEFLSEGNAMKIFDGDNGTTHLPYSYILGVNYNAYLNYEGINSDLGLFEIRIRENCVEDPSQYRVIWSDDLSEKIVGLGGSSYLREISTPLQLSPYAKYGAQEFITQPYTLSAQLVDLENNFQGEPLKIRIYPSQCLGPGSEMGRFSCCNTSLLFSHKDEREISLRESISISTALSTMPFSQEMYFGIPLDVDGTLEAEVGSIINYGEVDIWEEYSSNITSLYRGDVGGTCGPYSRWQHNIDSISGSQILGEVKEINSFKSIADEIFFDSNQIFENRNNEFLLTLDIFRSSTQKCEFPIVTNYSILVNYNDSSGKVFQLVGGLDARESLEPIPLGGQFNSIRVLCNSSWFAKHGQNSDDLSLFFSNSLGWDNTQIYRTKGFCSQGVPQCNRADSNIVFPSWEDPYTTNYYSGGVCTRTRFNGGMLEQESLSSETFLHEVQLFCLNSAGIANGTRTFQKFGVCSDTDPISSGYNCYNYSGSCQEGHTPSYPLDSC